jgi:hypothetical protein
LGLVIAKLRLPLSCVAQTDALSKAEFWGIDDATEKNLLALKGTANKLLTDPISRRNFATGKLVATEDGNNREALGR